MQQVTLEPKKPKMPVVKPEAGFSVLVVDDEQDIAEAARDVIEQMVPHCHVETADSCAQGLDAMSRHPFDAVLVDYRMPAGNGFEFIRAARAAQPEVPVILMTAYGSIELATEAVNACHVDGFLAKPIDAQALAQAVEGAIHRGAGEPTSDEARLAW